MTMSRIPLAFAAATTLSVESRFSQQANRDRRSDQNALNKPKFCKPVGPVLIVGVLPDHI